MRFSGALIACLALLLARQEAQATRGLRAEAPQAEQQQVCLDLATGPAAAAPYQPAYMWGSAALFGEEYSDMGAAFPAGAAGGADVLADGRLLGARFDPGTPVQEARELVERTLRSECSKAPGGAAAGFSPTAENTDDAAPPANASVACAPTIDGLDAVWAALPAELRPAMSGLARSDAAFARLRLTANPLMLRAVAALPEGWSPAGITGLDEAGIIAGTGLTLEQLLAAGRVFSVDFAPLAPVLLPAPGAHLEIPTALFFLDGNATGAGGTPEGDVSAFDAPSGTLDAGASKDSSSQLQLMPLAIKFTVFNNHTYSPRDTPADWFLAKAALNALDSSYMAAFHFFPTHLLLENICISAARNLAPTHPLYPLVTKPCLINTAIVYAGFRIIMANGTGTSDQSFQLSGWSWTSSLVPLWQNESWEGTYLAADLAARGVADVPGYAYAQDAVALYAALEKHATARLRSAYGEGPAALAGDAQLTAFLADLAPGGPGALPLRGGFPGPENITTPEALARVAAQVMWLAGVQHHALNSNRVFNFDFILPSIPGKLWAPPPADKGVLSEEELVARYLLPATVPDPANGTATPGLDWWLRVYDSGSRFRIAEEPGGETLLQAYAQYQPPEGCSSAAAQAAANAGAELRADLEAISAAVRARDAAAAAAGLPQYIMLDPLGLPAYTYT